MAVVFGNQPCIDPLKIQEACERQKLPTDWFGLPNSFRTTLGPHAGRGWLLMRLEDMQNLTNYPNGQYDLIIDDNQGGVVTIKKLLIFKARCVTPSFDQDPDSCYLVEVRDLRHLCQNEYFGNPVQKQYNVRAPDSGSSSVMKYYSGSTHASVLWDWQTMADDLWGYVNVGDLGGSPTIPGPLPAKGPESAVFMGVSAWNAYNEALYKIGVGFRMKLDGTADLTEFGAPDSGLDSAQQRFRDQLMLDDYPVESDIGKIPSQITIYHPKIAVHYGTEETTTSGVDQWTTSMVYSKTTTVASLGLPRTFQSYGGSTAFLHDDMACMVNYDGTIANQSDLDARDAERVADYMLMLDTRMRQQYIGIIPDPGFQPGLRVYGTAYSDNGRGYITEIVRYPLFMSVGDDGSWQTAKLFERLKPANLGRVGFPVYPPYLQMILIGAAASTNFYAGTVLRLRPTDLDPTNLESCWVGSMTTDSSGTKCPLTSGQVVGARLNGTHTEAGDERPLYLA